MKDSPLYEQLLNLPSVAIDDVTIDSHSITIFCHVQSLASVCPNCGQASSHVNQYYRRRLRDLNMGVRHVYLDVKMRQFYCSDCNRYYSEQLDFADLNKDFTHRQTDYMFCLARKQSYTEVAAIVDTSPKTIERLVLARCSELIDVPARYRQVRRLGIDEHSHRKGKKDTLIAHFQGLGAEFCGQITDVSCDCWDAYIEASRLCFPQANIVLDRFHVVKLLNESLDAVRKQLRESDKDNPIYKKLKWLLYKQYHTLSDAQLDTMQLAFEHSPCLEQIYRARERFHHILDTSESVESALAAMQQWENDLAQQHITAFDRFVKTLRKIKEYVANYVLDHLSNAATEGLNNLIRSVRRTAFGMTNFIHLRLRVLAISD